MKVEKQLNLENLKNIIGLIKESGIYKWYITAKGAEQLGLPIDGCYLKDDTHYLVYIGSGKNLEQRLKYHIKGPKTLSTLRKSLSALLEENNEDKITEFIKQHMVFNYVNREDYGEYENKLIKENILPLNIKNNNHPFIKTLKQKRNGRKI